MSGSQPFTSATGAAWLSAIGLATGIGVPRVVAAQRAGIELGLAGIENYPPVTPSVGLALQSPEWRRLSASAAYARWGGRDGNEDPGAPRSGYGNQAVLLTGLVRALSTRHLAASLGGGAGFFQKYVAGPRGSASRYDRVAVGTLAVTYPRGGRFEPYLRTDVQIPGDQPLQYGLVRLGASIALRR